MVSDKSRICLVTSRRPSMNPRRIEEDDAFSEFGYDRRMVVCIY